MPVAVNWTGQPVYGETVEANIQVSKEMAGDHAAQERMLGYFFIPIIGCDTKQENYHAPLFRNFIWKKFDGIYILRFANSENPFETFSKFFVVLFSKPLVIKKVIPKTKK